MKSFMKERTEHKAKHRARRDYQEVIPAKHLLDGSKYLG